MNDSLIPGLKFSVLGPVRAWIEGQEVSLGSPQQRALLAVLLLRDGSWVTLDELVDEVWGEDVPRSAAGVTRGYVYKLRQVLPEDSIRSLAGGYVMPGGVGVLDLKEVGFLVDQARAACDERAYSRASHLFSEALRRWKGTPLAGIPGPHAQAQRNRLRRLQLSVLEESLTVELVMGKHAEAIAMLTGLLSQEPARPMIRQLLMLALYRSGRQAEALALYQESRTVTAHSGETVANDPELTQLHGRILASDPGLLDGVRSPFQSELPVPAQLPRSIPDFSGRADLVQSLIVTLEAPNEAGVVGIHGLPRVGKSALAVHVGHSVKALYPDGQIYVDFLNGRGQDRTPLAVLGEILCSFGIPDHKQPSELGNRTRYWRKVLKQNQILMILDNVQHPDEIEALLPEPGESCSRAIVTTRMILELSSKTGWHHLSVMSSSEEAVLLARIVDAERLADDPESVTRLLSRCNGFPSAVRQVAELLSMRPEWSVAAVAERCAVVDQLGSA